MNSETSSVVCWFPGLIAAMILVLLIGCVAAPAAEAPQFRTLARGAFSGVQEPIKDLIKNQAAWEKFWAKHSSQASPPESRPKVDFSKEMVLVLTMGQQRTGGYAIEIVAVEPADKKLKISYKRTSPPSGSITIQALTAPFHFVAVPKSDLKPDFVEVRNAQ